MVKQVQITVYDVLQLDKQSHSNLFRDPGFEIQSSGIEGSL